MNEFTYLGIKVATDGDSEREVNSRITKTNQSFAMLKNREPYAGHQVERGRPNDTWRRTVEKETDLGNHHQTGRKPTAVELSCGSLMCHLNHEED